MNDKKLIKKVLKYGIFQKTNSYGQFSYGEFYGTEILVDYTNQCFVGYTPYGYFDRENDFNEIDDTYTHKCFYFEDYGTRWSLDTKKDKERVFKDDTKRHSKNKRTKRV